MPYKDREKQLAYQKEWHKRTSDKRREKWRKYNNEGRAKIRRFLNRVLMKHGCQVCGYKKCIRSLHFHHIDPTTKEHLISDLTSNKRSLKTIKNEMRKCAILCANCHGEVHEGLIDLNKYIRQ